MGEGEGGAGRGEGNPGWGWSAKQLATGAGDLRSSEVRRGGVSEAQLVPYPLIYISISIRQGAN